MSVRDGTKYFKKGHVEWRGAKCSILWEHAQLIYAPPTSGTEVESVSSYNRFFFDCIETLEENSESLKHNWTNWFSPFLF